MTICNTVVVLKIAVLKTFEKIPVKYLCRSLFLNNTAGYRPETL